MLAAWAGKMVESPGITGVINDEAWMFGSIASMALFLFKCLDETLERIVVSRAVTCSSGCSSQPSSAPSFVFAAVAAFAVGAAIPAEVAAAVVAAALKQRFVQGRPASIPEPYARSMSV